MDIIEKIIKGRKTYSKEFKLQVVTEVERGLITKEEARRKYGINGKSAILYWQRMFNKLPERQATRLKKSNKKVSQQKVNNPYEQRIKELEKQLAEEKLKTLVYTTIIDIAEKELKIPIRKKYLAKPSGK
jgi:transposase-like protein